MAYLEIQAFKKLRAFFWALNTSNFNLSHLPLRDNRGIPVDKAYCLNLLRSFPDLQGEKFKDDNFLVKHLSKPANMQQIFEKFTPSQKMEVVEVLSEKPIAVESVGEQPTVEETPPSAGEPATSMAETPNLPFSSSIPSTPRSPLIIHDIPHTQEELKSELVVANKSGVVEEEPPSKILVANKGGVVTGEHQITPELTTVTSPKPETPKLVIANKSGMAIETPTQTSQPKLVVANKSGVITQPPPSRIYTASKSGTITGEHPITPLSSRKFSFQAPGFLKNAGSSLQKSFYSNIGSKITLNNALGGAGKLLQKAGGLLGGGLNSSTPLLSKAGNGVVNFGVRLSNSSSGFSRSSILKPKKRIWLYALGLFMFMFGFSLFGALFNPSNDDDSSGVTPVSAGTIGDGGCPASIVLEQNKNANSCKYLNPSIDLFATNISAQAINDYINKYSSVFTSAGKGDKNEFIRRVNYIIDNSKQAGLNPAIFLGYWRSESGFSTVGSRHMGCVGESFEEQVHCALGIKEYSDPQKNPIPNCARSKDAESVACKALKSIRVNNNLDTAHPVNYPVSTFDDFAESYGPYAHLSAGQPTNCTHTYNLLIETAEQLNSCISTTPASIGGGIITPAGAGGERIGGVAKQIAKQLIHSTKPEDREKRAGLASLGIACDPGGSAGASYHCWEKEPQYNQITGEKGYLQCTEFVWAVFAEAGYRSQIDKIRTNDAFYWPEAALKNPDTFEVFDDATKLAPGDIIASGLGGGGIAQHVAVVVAKSDTVVQIAQASTASAIETYYIENGKLKIINPTNARCTPASNQSCKLSFIRLKTP